MESVLRPTPAWVLSSPKPRSHPPSISPDALHELLTTKAPVLDFIVVDVRRTGIDAVIPGAINLPAQTFYQLLPTLTSLLATIPIVIFYCCSSVGRAACCAGWFEDALPPDSTCKVFTLEGGIKAWRARTGENKQVVVVMPLEEARGTGTGTGK